MQFHTSSGSAPPAMFSAQYQAAAGSPQQQVTILEQAGDYLKQPSASLAEDQPTVLDILRTLRLAFPGNQMQQSLTLFQSIINRLIALPSAPTPELMHQIGLAITELCMLGNENTAIMNGTWKCFMKLIAKHPQSFSADLVQFIFLVIVYSLLIKMQANMNVQATSIYIKFFSSHLTTLLRLFPKQLLNSLPYIIRLLVLIKSMFATQNPDMGQPLESCYLYVLRPETDLPRRKIFRFLFEFPTPLSMAEKYPIVRDLQSIELVANLVDTRELARAKILVLSDLLMATDLDDDYAMERIFRTVHQLSRQQLLDSYDDLLGLLGVCAHSRPMHGIMIRWVLSTSSCLCAQLFSDALILTLRMTPMLPTQLARFGCAIIDLLRKYSVNSEACFRLASLLLRLISGDHFADSSKRQIIQHINAVIVSSPSQPVEMVQSIALLRWIPLNNLCPAMIESLLQSKLLQLINFSRRTLEKNPQSSLITLQYCRHITQHPSLQSSDHLEIVQLRDCCLKSLGATIPTNVQSEIMEIIAILIRGLDESSFIRSLKLITELLLRSKDSALFHSAGNYFRRSALFPGQRFKPVSSIYFVNFTTAFFKPTTIHYPQEEWLRSVFRNLNAYVFSVVSEIPADYVFEPRIMETWIRYAERTAVDQSISYEGMQKFSEDQIGFTLFGTLPQDPSTASQLSNALTNVCKLLKQFDPDEIGSQQRLVGLQESMNETVKTLTSILSLL